MKITMRQKGHLHDAGHSKRIELQLLYVASMSNTPLDVRDS